MTFGFRSINENSYVQIDADSQRLCMIEKGSYSGKFSASAAFSRPIASIEPPMIFIRPAGSDLHVTTYITGSAGNWTGFVVYAANVNTVLTGSWFAAVFSARANSSYGMRIWDAGGGMVYDTGAYPVVVTTILPSWSYAGKFQTDIGAYYKFVAGRGLAADEYFSINDFSLGMQDYNGSAGTCGLSCDYSANQTCLWTNNSTSNGPWLDNGHRPVVMAKLTI